MAEPKLCRVRVIHVDIECRLCANFTRAQSQRCRRGVHCVSGGIGQGKPEVGKRVQQALLSVVVLTGARHTALLVLSVMFREDNIRMPRKVEHDGSVL